MDIEIQNENVHTKLNPYFRRSREIARHLRMLPMRQASLHSFEDVMKAFMPFIKIALDSPTKAPVSRLRVDWKEYSTCLAHYVKDPVSIVVVLPPSNALYERYFQEQLQTIAPIEPLPERGVFNEMLDVILGADFRASLSPFLGDRIAGRVWGNIEAYLITLIGAFMLNDRHALFELPPLSTKFAEALPLGYSKSTGRLYVIAE